MIRLFVFVLFFSTVSLWAVQENREKTKVLLQAENIYGSEDNLYAKDHIVLHYQDMRLIANFAHYDKKNRLLTVIGSVQIVNRDGSKIETEKITFDVAGESIVFEKFLYANSTKTWISSLSATKKDNCYSLNAAAFSTCAVNNPDWHLGFSEAKYNAATKYIKLKDIKFYIDDTPVFYFPYLAFSTSKERSSGLLIPKFGYSSKEGLLYEQPVYWAISQSVDMEFNPQLRSERGGGMYTTLRFADSSQSEGVIRAGYFADTEKYAKEYNLENDSHYGIEGVYTSSNLIGKYLPSDYKDALYANLLLFNDIDYLNLQNKKISHLSDSHLKESRVNYVIYSEDNYFGINAKYFLDASTNNNKGTLQELPSLRWHKYHDKLFDIDNLSYSVDMKLSNYSRIEGVSSRQMEVSIPAEYHFSLFDDYLKLELGEELFLFKGSFDGATADRDDYSSILSIHSIKLYTDLVKSWNTGIHAVRWSALFEKQNYFGDGLTAYRSLDINTSRDFLTHEHFDERITLSFGQYWYANDLALEMRQRVYQTYYPERDEKWGDVRHELDLKYNNWKISNLFEYSFEHNGISEMSNSISYDADNLYLGIKHFFRQDLLLDSMLTNEIAFDGKYQYDKNLKLFTSLTYDLDNENSTKWSSGFRYDKGCWAVELTYIHDTKPILESGGGGSIANNTFLVKLSLQPFGESEIAKW